MKDVTSELNAYIKENISKCDRATLIENLNKEFGFGDNIPTTRNKYTDEERAWIRENYSKYDRTTGCRLFNEKFGRDIYPKLYTKIANHLGLKKAEHTKYTEAELAFIREKNEEGLSYKKISVLFKEKFGFTISESGIASCASAHGFTKGITPYTEEEKQWLIENYYKYRQTELFKRFCETFNRKIKYPSSLYNFCRINLGLTRDTQHEWQPEEIEFIRTLNEQKYTYEAMIPLIQERFCFNATINSLKTIARKKGISKEKHDSYTVEQDDWLIYNVGKYKNYEEVCEAFNNIFKTSKKPRGIQSHCVRYLDIVSGRQAFKRGNKPWCTKETLEESTLMSGYTLVKLSDSNWIPKQQYVWEQANRPLKEGEFVIFLNRDRTDFRLENLWVVDRATHARMCQNGWYSENPEFTKTAMMLCDLNKAIKEGKND